MADKKQMLGFLLIEVLRINFLLRLTQISYLQAFALAESNILVL